MQTEDGRTPVACWAHAKRIIAATWRFQEKHVMGGFVVRNDGLRVMVSAAIERDGKTWLHVSLSRAERIPSWDDLKDVRETFIPDDLVALQVFPPPDEYVNINPHVLHLWACVDGRVTPDFRHDGGV
jgi:hypothetical protein